VLDVNQDARPDFFIPHTEQSEANLLYVQQPDGRFVDQAREYGLAFERQEEPGSMALFAGTTGLLAYEIFSDLKRGRAVNLPNHPS